MIEKPAAGAKKNTPEKTTSASGSKPPKPKPKRSPATLKVELAENYLANGWPKKTAELLDEAEKLEGGRTG